MMTEREAQAIIKICEHIQAEEFDKADDLIELLESGELKKSRDDQYQPENGHIVFMRWDVNLRGVISQAGPEQSEIKFESGARQIFPNHHFVLGRPRTTRGR